MGCQAPAPSQAKSLVPGDRGAGAAGAAGLLATGAGGGIPAPQSGVRRSRLARALPPLMHVPGRGESQSHPSLRSPPPPPERTRAAPAVLAQGTGRTGLGCSSGRTLLCFMLLLASRVSPQSPMGHSLSPRGCGGSACTSTSESVCIPPPELRALCPPLRFLRETGCSLRLGIQPFPPEREGFPLLAFVSSSLLGTPSRDGPEAGEERTFPGSRFPPSRKPCVPCMSDFVALYLGNIPPSVRR